MRIVAYVNKGSAVSYHRILAPLLLMPDVDFYATNNLQVEAFEKGCDIFLYNRIINDSAKEQIAELKAKYGFKTIVDIDDYWELDKHHVLYDEYQKTDFAGRQVRHIREADAVLCTHERLAEEISPYNENVHILPNAIPKAGQFVIEHKPHRLIRLYWQGSPTHRQDIGVLAHASHMMADISTKIQMVMAGYIEGDPIWHEMVMNYTAGVKHQYKLIPACDVDKYYLSYSEADICLVPLVRSRFNSGKSNLKILEAANAGLPVIASEVHPYLNMPVFYANKASDWVKHVKKLIRSTAARRDAGLKLQEFCDKHYNFEKINIERKQVFEYATILNRNNGS